MASRLHPELKIRVAFCVASQSKILFLSLINNNKVQLLRLTKTEKTRMATEFFSNHAGFYFGAREGT
jgi:hypothetical protein